MCVQNGVHNSLVVRRVGQMDRALVVHLVVMETVVVHLVVVGTAVHLVVVGEMVDQCVVGLVRQINLSGLRLVLPVF